MAWNKDKQIAADIGLFRSLFPEQTKSPTHIVIWSFILLADVALCVVGALHFGFLSLGNFLELTIGLIIVVAVVLFWLQGIAYGAITRLIKKK